MSVAKFPNILELSPDISRVFLSTKTKLSLYYALINLSLYELINVI